MYICIHICIVCIYTHIYIYTCIIVVDDIEYQGDYTGDSSWLLPDFMPLKMALFSSIQQFPSQNLSLLQFAASIWVNYTTTSTNDRNP